MCNLRKSKWEALKFLVNMTNHVSDVITILDTGIAIYMITRNKIVIKRIMAALFRFTAGTFDDRADL